MTPAAATPISATFLEKDFSPSPACLPMLPTVPSSPPRDFCADADARLEALGVERQGRDELRGISGGHVEPSCCQPSDLPLRGADGSAGQLQALRGAVGAIGRR